MLRMKEGSISLLNAKRVPAVVIASEINVSPVQDPNNYQNMLQDVHSQPAIILTDSKGGFGVVKCDQKD